MDLLAQLLMLLNDKQLPGLFYASCYRYLHRLPEAAQAAFWICPVAFPFSWSPVHPTAANTQHLSSFGPATGCPVPAGAADCLLPDACRPIPIALSCLWLAGVCQTPVDLRAGLSAPLTLA